MNNETQKINLALIFGGKTAEHEVSVISARNVFEAINKNKYAVTLVGITKKGNWIEVSEKELLDDKNFVEVKNDQENFLIPFSKDENFFLRSVSEDKLIDVVFPLIHGPFGEDGSIQGMLKMFNVPFVGASVLGSAVGMDKEISKKLFKEAGLPIGKFIVFEREEKNNLNFEKIKKELGLPMFLKPANLGSSVGVSKVKNEDEFKKAVELSFSYDPKLIIEEYIEGKEIECSILGNQEIEASVAGEIIPTHEFYSYEAKYLDENGAKMSIPANIEPEILERVQDLAKKSFKALACEGMGRVDFFLTKDNELFVNEINTLPGFTSISMYPKLWQESGLAYTDLIEKLIRLAFERQEREKIKTEK